MYKYRFSIFTATYNRAKYLPEVYECLKRQTFKDFEWVIVDDGSTDNTEEICRGFMADGIIPIKYIKKANGGKHTAWREATKVFDGRYVLGADDDDLMPDNALEIFNKHWCELEHHTDYDKYWEVRACVQNEDGKIVTPPLPADVFDSDYIEINFKYKFEGREMHGCRKVEVLRNEAAVPEHFIYEDKCSNFPEAIRWIRAARKYKTRFVSDIVRYYVRRDGEALTSSNRGTNRSAKRTYNSVVGGIFALNEYSDLLGIKSLLTTTFLLSYHQLCLNRNVTLPLTNTLHKALIYLLTPLAEIVYIIREH